MSSKFKIDDGTEVGCECNISNIITQRLRDKNVRFFGNDNISEHVTAEEISALVDEVAGKMESVLRSLVIDVDNDHNTRDTARRVAKMFVNETFSGRYQPPPRVTSFPNMGYKSLYTSGPISVRSVCGHHLQNIVGSAWVGVVPEDEVIGLSKFNRIVHHYANRPQIQEEFTSQITAALSEYAKTPHVAVVVKAEHFCMTQRGVREHENDMTTAVMLGAFKSDPALRNEFYQILGTMKGHSGN
jgi:GTP cyclohydrolase I